MLFSLILYIAYLLHVMYYVLCIEIHYSWYVHTHRRIMYLYVFQCSTIICIFSYIIDGMSFMLSHIIDAMKYIKLIIDGYY